jgi:hypothetical protein
MRTRTFIERATEVTGARVTLARTAGRSGGHRIAREHLRSRGDRGRRRLRRRGRRFCSNPRARQPS